MPERYPGDHPHLYSFFKHENRFYHVREGDLFETLQGFANKAFVSVSGNQISFKAWIPELIALIRLGQ
jgi:hypothetical protein